MTETLTLPRTTRGQEKREVAERAKAWAPPALLPDPVLEEGYTFRWIRVSTQNVSDPTNISAKFREGWEPVSIKTQPQMAMFSGNNARYPDSIEIGGLMLCKCPTEFMEQRAAHYQKQADNQMESVDNSFMRQSDARMPLFSEKRTKVTFGKGT